MSSYIKIQLFLTILTFSFSSFSHSHAPTDHAPIGVMGDHTHNRGEWMVSYRYMNMFMEDNRNAKTDLSNADVLSQFPVTPTNMTMQMHMLGVMYGLTNRLTILAMGNYITTDMDHLTRMGGEFSTQSQGFGDTNLGFLYSLIKSDHKKLNLIIGLSAILPTGSVNRRDDLPIGNQLRLPYPMQLGSGTYGVEAQATIVKKINQFNLGAQIKRVQRIGRNDRDYRLGNITTATIWGALNLDHQFSISLRALYSRVSNIVGVDSDLNPMMIATARNDLRSSERAEAFVGVNYLMASGHRLAFEFGKPFYQFVSGPQLKADYQMNLGWQYAF